MAYTKCHSNINYENEPSVATPLNETNLNYTDNCVDILDNRVVELSNSKLSVLDANGLVTNLTMDSNTGIFTVTKRDGSTYTIDTKLEKIAVNFDYNQETQKLVITLDDGTTKDVDLSALVQDNDFVDGTEIAFSVVGHTVSASIKAHSITEDKLQPDFLSDCQIAKSGAELAQGVASASSLASEGYAVGTQNGVPVDASSPYYQNNAKYYSDKTSGQSLSALNDVNLSAPENNQSLVYEDGKWVNKEVKAGRTEEIVNDVLYASHWTGTEAPYSYDLGIASGYDFEVNLTNAVTKDMIDSIMSYTIIGNMSDNILRAFGEKPEIDIPIIIRKWEREVS